MRHEPGRADAERRRVVIPGRHHGSIERDVTRDSGRPRDFARGDPNGLILQVDDHSFAGGYRAGADVDSLGGKKVHKPVVVGRIMMK